MPQPESERVAAPKEAPARVRGVVLRTADNFGTEVPASAPNHPQGPEVG